MGCVCGRDIPCEGYLCKPRKFQMHVEIERGVFKPIRPTGGDPYEYDTEEEAAKMAAIAYDRITGPRVKIVEVS